jgi:hypothetical protein
MSRDLELECKCGSVRGLARDVSPSTINRVICLCADCQAFAHHLGRPDLLDARGGSDIVQLAPDAVSFHTGTDKIAAVRLGPKGPFRWYATCCKTPLGNTVKPSVPFVGILHEAFRDARDPSRRDAVFGPVRASMYEHHAIGGGTKRTNAPFLLRTARLILGWKLRGRAWPHPYFDRSTGDPRFQVRVLSRDERASARKAAGRAPAA